MSENNANDKQSINIQTDGGMYNEGTINHSGGQLITGSVQGDVNYNTKTVTNNHIQGDFHNQGVMVVSNGNVPSFWDGFPFSGKDEEVGDKDLNELFLKLRRQLEVIRPANLSQKRFLNEAVQAVELLREVVEKAHRDTDFYPDEAYMKEILKSLKSLGTPVRETLRQILNFPTVRETMHNFSNLLLEPEDQNF
jgi:hypothetical protein